MKEYNDGINVYIKIGNETYVLPMTLDGLIDQEELLKVLTLKELALLWLNHGGIPSNYKSLILKKVNLYDSSSEVSSFIFKGKNYWLDKSQRSSIANLLNLTLELGEENFELILDEEVFELPIETVKTLLSKLELYSYKCLINTKKHLSDLNKLDDLGEIVKYDYTTGYPDKIVIE